MSKRDEAAPMTGLAYWLARLKGLWAALYPLYEVYQAVSSDGTITSQEIEEIVQALIVFAGVWLIPNLGYVRSLRDKFGRRVQQGVTNEDQVPIDLGQEPSRHEFTDSDHDGISDAAELRANDPDTVAAQRPAARRLQDWERDQDRP